MMKRYLIEEERRSLDEDDDSKAPTDLIVTTLFPVERVELMRHVLVAPRRTTDVEP
ncbi:MAG: hypothetical protein GY820_26990 [Gammaproteobacteria bacterium]|nr:hypothetical protein [Gammaproteobacteria bacterium]